MRRYQLIPSTAVQTLLITSSSPLPSGEIGAPYSFGFNAIGGVLPYTWSEIGSLPTGLSLSTSGTLFGTPTATFAGSFTVKVTDAISSQYSKTFNLTVVTGLTITTSSPLPSANQGSPYTFTMTAAGGATPYAWSLLSQTGGNGWSVSSAGIVSGTPSVSETDTLLIQVVDALGVPSSANFNLTVNSTATGVFLAINSSGRFVNSAGTPIQLRGFNLAGMENQIFNGNTSNPWGNSAESGSPAATSTGITGPSFPAIALWKPNFFRLMLNGTAFLNLQFGHPVWGGSLASSTWSSSGTADPLNTYKAAVMNCIIGARTVPTYAGMIIDLHCSTPQFTLGGQTMCLEAIDQPPFMNFSTDSIFWYDPVQSFPVWLATTFGSAAFNTANGFNGGAAGAHYNSAFGGSSGFNDIIFEPFNEPFINAGINSIVWTLTQKNGTGGDSGIQCPNSPISIPDTFMNGVEFGMLNGCWVSCYSMQSANNGIIPAQFTSPPNVSPSSPGGIGSCLAIPWRMLGYQEVVNGVRALGFTNIISCNTLQYTNSHIQIPYICPVDTLSPPQLSFGMHAYPTTYNSATALPANGDGGTSWHATADQQIAGVTIGPHPYVTPSWTTGWVIGLPRPVVYDEWADSSGNSALQPMPQVQAVTTWYDSAPAGSVALAYFAWNSPSASSFTGLVIQDLARCGTSISITASISGTTMTVTAGSGIVPGMIIVRVNGSTQSETVAAAYVYPFGTGGTTGSGGTGTYQISISQSLGSSTLLLGLPGPFPGGSQTYHDWLVAHL